MNKLFISTMKAKAVLSGTLIMLCVFLVKAQDYKADFAKAMAIYKEKAYEVQMEYSFFPTYTAEVPLEKETIGMKRKGEKFYANQFGIQTLCDEKYLLIIDDETKTIAIDFYQKPSNKKVDPKLKAQLDKTIKSLSLSLGLDSVKGKEENYKVDFLGIKNGKKQYACTYKSGQYEKSIITLDAKLGHIVDTKFFYREPMDIDNGRKSKVRVEINYVKQQANPSFSKEIFDIKKYLEIRKNGEVILADKYKKYTLINHLVKPKA